LRTTAKLTRSILQRVVVQALLYAAQEQKKRFQVYVTESRPFGLGIKTQAILSKAGIPTQVILDSAVAYIMPKVDAAVVGAEAVCESGGLINFVSLYDATPSFRTLTISHATRLVVTD